MSSKKLPPPIINRRLLALAAILAALALGLLAGLFLGGVVVFLVVILLVVALAVVLMAWDDWRRQYQAWASVPVRAKRVKKEVAQ